MDGSMKHPEDRFSPKWMGVSSEARIKDLEKKLEGRTDHSGKPLPGAARNVEAIKAEISRLARKAKVKNPLKDK
jgi:hypothetical protein